MTDKKTEIEVKEKPSLKSEGGFLAVANNYISGENGIAIAPDYDVNASVKYLYLQVLNLKDKTGRAALDVITPKSIEMSVRDMIAKGLNPMKKQCYPIVYGTELQIQPSYQGNKRAAYTANKEIVKGSIRSQVIYEGDTFEDMITPDGRRELVKHTQPPFAERSGEFVGAYAVVTYRGGKTDMDVMSKKEILASWAKSKTSGTVHKEFPHEMACKTVESRLAKKLYSSTDESVSEASDIMKAIFTEAQEVEYDIVDETPTPKQDFPPDFEPEDEVVDAEELPELPNFGTMTVQTDEIHEIKYGDWKTKWSLSGEWEQVPKSFDKAKNTVLVRKVTK